MPGPQKFLIVDHDPQTLPTIINTLTDAIVDFERSDTIEHAIDTLRASSEFTDVIVRGHSHQIDGLKLCRELRELPECSTIQIYVLLNDDQLSLGADFLLAGARDLLVGTFEPRELRLRAGIVPTDQHQRIDAAHARSVDAPTFHVPQFNAQTMKFDFGAQQHLLPAWEQDERTCRVALDRIIVCPDCSAVPTIRSGCGSCGSAWVEEETLLHHYACAHVGPEADFRRGDDLVCPKCRLTGLVAGSDFERMSGARRCQDCYAEVAADHLIGHCLACQLRFPLHEGRVQEIYGYQVGGTPAKAIVPTPNVAAWSANSPATSVANDCQYT